MTKLLFMTEDEVRDVAKVILALIRKRMEYDKGQDK